MGRKDASRFLAIEAKLEMIGKLVAEQRVDFERFVGASRGDWQDLRNFLTKMIEGN